MMMEEEASCNPAGEWKSYTNPLFHNPCHHHHRRYHRHRRHHRSNEPNSVDLEALKAELENERTLRRKAEIQSVTLARELEVERKRTEAVEGELKVLSLEAATLRREVEKERKAMREERLQKAAILAGTHEPKSRGDDGKDVEEVEEVEEVEVKAVRRRENPHIRRGAIGFVEFPRILRAREGKGEVRVPKLECQKAQLRVLLRKNRVNPLGNGGYICTSGGTDGNGNMVM